ncbi:hypothetical protein OAU50_07225 [Planctomycetota bacterium]|nr:hypothetical protein [Planctomycetota bacterium]
MSAVPHLNELDEKFRSRGFEIMNVSNRDTAAALKDFVAKHKITFGVIRSDDIKNFKFTGYPTSWAVGLDGKVLWKGHPSRLKDEMIEGWLENVPQPKIVEDRGDALKGAVKAYNEGEYGKALTEATKIKDKADDNAENAGKVLAVINKRIELSNKRVDAAKEAGELVAAGQMLEDLATGFKGSDNGDEYSKQAKALTKSKEYKNAVKAGEELDKLREKLPYMTDKKALKALNKIAKKYDETKAGKEAAELAKDYE